MSVFTPAETLKHLGINSTTLNPKTITNIVILLKELGTYLSLQFTDSSIHSEEQFPPQLIENPASKQLLSKTILQIQGIISF